MTARDKRLLAQIRKQAEHWFTGEIDDKRFAEYVAGVLNPSKSVCCITYDRHGTRVWHVNKHDLDDIECRANDLIRKREWSEDRAWAQATLDYLDYHGVDRHEFTTITGINGEGRKRLEQAVIDLKTGKIFREWAYGTEW